MKLHQSIKTQAGQQSANQRNRRRFLIFELETKPILKPKLKRLAPFNGGRDAPLFKASTASRTDRLSASKSRKFKAVQRIFDREKELLFTYR